MANPSIWPGSSSFFPGETPFGFYDSDVEFAIDAEKVSDFCARRLGYPLTDVELQASNFFTAFEEAVTTYGNEVYAFKASENYLSIEGSATGSNLNYKLTQPNLGAEMPLNMPLKLPIGVRTAATIYTRFILPAKIIELPNRIRKFVV